ncbi:hypothetical protein PHISCL_04332 [Aspergillus sclerotialis]|uniref:2-dehydropantoate 2-reductase n=1 Tax=Aspergillus sclerotialis TaxID=2070753 RepID=A0A3A2ZJX5_9EURO|nr:hypothetical protein PHISCL_04332 [Aspergillus sclerotialis]
MSLPSHPIYILGLGSIGTLIAHSLRSLPQPPPIKLLVHRKDLFDELASNEWKLGLRVQEDGPLNEQDGFEGELVDENTPADPIHHLIVAVKASTTASALKPLRHRIGPHTAICFFQNGLGQLDDLNERIFTEIQSRPTYAYGIMYHGAYMKSPFETILSSRNGRAALGVVGAEERQSLYLLDVLLRSPVLCCEQLSWTNLLNAQLLKLAANCVINPLTALLDVRNGSIKDNLHLRPVWISLLRELLNVFERLPELQNHPERFTMESLEAAVLGTVEKTAENSSSMREDVRKGRKTEIDYLNSWVVRRGKELGVDCEVNNSITQLVLAKNSQ